MAEIFRNYNHTQSIAIMFYIGLPYPLKRKMINCCGLQGINSKHQSLSFEQLLIGFVVQCSKFSIDINTLFRLFRKLGLHKSYF